MTHEEHLNVIKYTCEVVNKRIPVVAGTGSNCTETAVYLSKEAEKYGADGLLLVSPYYNKATQNGLIAHFTAGSRCCEDSDYSLQYTGTYRRDDRSSDDCNTL